MINSIEALKVGMTEDEKGTGERQEKGYWKIAYLIGTLEVEQSFDKHKWSKKYPSI